MFRVIFGLAMVIAAGLIAAGSAAAGDGRTIRVEPRPFYGATVSLESGVRVYRPLPPTTHVIINPNQTPLRVSIKDVTKHVYKTVNHRYSFDGAPYGGHRLAIGNYVPHAGFKRGMRRRFTRRHGFGGRRFGVRRGGLRRGGMRR